MIRFIVTFTIMVGLAFAWGFFVAGPLGIPNEINFLVGMPLGLIAYFIGCKFSKD